MKKYYRGKRVLITGANGFIGSHLAAALLDAGAQVIAAAGPHGDITRISARQGEMLVLRGDLTKRGEAKRIIRESKPQILFNLASTTMRETAPEYRETIVQNIYDIAHNVLDAAAEEGVVRFVQMGSMEEYGAAEAPYKESAQEKPQTPYGRGKVRAAHAALLQGRSSTMEITVIRPSAVFGEGQDFGRMLIPNIIKSALDGRDFEMHDGKNMRDFLYVEDLVEGLLLAGSNASAAGEIINLGAGSPVQVREVAEMTNNAMGNPIRIRFGVKPHHPHEVPAAYLDCSKAERLLGWSARTPLVEALKKTAAWYRSEYAK